MDKRKTDLFIALMALSVISSIFYVVIRALLLFFVQYRPIEIFFAAILVCGEFFVVIHGIGYVFNIIRVMKNKPQKTGIEKFAEKKEPSVAVLVAARHEPKEVLENTFITLRNLNYKNKDIYLLDDSSEYKYKKEADELSEEYGFYIFRRKERHGAKAGIINDCLNSLTHDYVAVFDADQNPLPDFLKAVIPLLENDKTLAFVQTPQFYSNIDSSAVARGAAFQQVVFYEYICEGKSINDSMFCCGTNVIFRRKALADAGGLDESTVTEDFATSIKLHSKGWKSLYCNHVYAFGMGPENLSGYFKQQFRWAVGTLSVFKKLAVRLVKAPFSLSLIQWWEYFLSSSYYLIGLAFFVMMICPVVYLLFKVPSFFAKPEIYFLAFMPYIILSLSVFYIVLRNRNYKVKDLFIGQLLGEITFSVYMRAAISAVLGAKITFGITEKSNMKPLAYIKLWPQLSLFFLSFISIVWGVNRYIYERETAILVNSFWAVYDMIILSSVFYFNRKAR